MPCPPCGFVWAEAPRGGQSEITAARATNEALDIPCRSASRQHEGAQQDATRSRHSLTCCQRGQRRMSVLLLRGQGRRST